MARRTVLTDTLAYEVAANLEEGCSIADACALAGIAESTYHDWVRRGDAGEAPFSEFSELTRAARAKGRREHIQAIKKAASDDWRAAAFFLERSDPANWGPKHKVQSEHTGDIAIRVEYADAEPDHHPAAPPPGAGPDPP